MKLILTQEVTGLGAPGDVVDVKDGYARNYLMPRSLATPWTKGSEKQVTAIRKARQARELATLEDAQKVRASLESKPVTLSAKAGKSGRLFGAITPADVAAAVSAAGGPALDRRKVELTKPIKAIGDYTVKVRLYADIQASIKLQVIAG